MERNTITNFFTWRTAIVQSDLHSTMKLLLLVISCHMNELGKNAFPSAKTLAIETSTTRQNVQRQLKKAEELGWLKIERRIHGNGAVRSNMYEASTPRELRVPPRELRVPPPGTEGSTNNSSNNILFKKLNKKAGRILTYLNKKTGKSFKPIKTNLTHIITRLQDGYTCLDCIKVIDNKSRDKFFQDNPKFMRPDTLFRPKNFENYLNELPKILVGGEQKKSASSKIKTKTITGIKDL